MDYNYVYPLSFPPFPTTQAAVLGPQCPAFTTGKIRDCDTRGINSRRCAGNSLRRSLWWRLSIGLAVASVATQLGFAEPLNEQPVNLVHPLIGSDRSRTFFMTAAARPFGMVKLAPDTEIYGYYRTGYQNSKNSIFGFSHLHEFKMGGLAMMPVSGNVDPVPGPERWKSTFRSEAQIVEPGYQRLHLDRYNIDVELTATRRVGFHRYTYLQAGEAKILIPLSGVWGEGRMVTCDVDRVGAGTLEGSMVFGESRFTRGSQISAATRIFFVIQTDRPFKSLDGWRTQESLHTIAAIHGEDSGLVINFGKILGGTAVKMKVAISYCSIDQARLNLGTELPGWDFDGVRADARNEWNKSLGRIEIQGTTERKIKFYTDLWHALLGRGIFSDVNGRYPIYRGNEMIAVKSLPLDDTGHPLFEMHVSDAFWWTQNNLNTLWGLAYPDVLRDFCNSWLRFYDDTGELPLGACVGRVDYIMSGAQSYPLFGRAIQMNLPGVDPEHAFAAMKKTQTANNRWMGNIEAFDRLGYLPADEQPNWSVTYTVEDAWCDWVLGQAAKRLGKANDAELYIHRSLGWKKLYNSKTGWLQPRNSDGQWLDSFDPVAIGTQHFLESSSSVLTWFPVHDLDGMVSVMGGRQKAIDRLDEQFKQAEKQGFRFGWLQYDNDTALQIAHLFNLLGDPVKSQYWVRKVHTANYSAIGTAPDAYCDDDEDEGQMGSLSALMTMGLFQVLGGCETDPSYELTAPMLECVRIHLQSDCYGAREFVITAGPNPDANPYIKSVTLNGRPLKNLAITQKEISAGAHLDFVLSATPNPDWANNPK